MLIRQSRQSALGLRSRFLACVPAVVLLAASGCAVVETSVINPVPGLSRVAIVPFFNHSQEPAVDGREFAMAYYAELQKVPGFHVVPVSVSEVAIHQHGLQFGDDKDAARLAKILDVDAVVIGAVTDFTPYYPPRVGLDVTWYTTRDWGFVPGAEIHGIQGCPTDCAPTGMPTFWAERKKRVRNRRLSPGAPHQARSIPATLRNLRNRSLTRPESLVIRAQSSDWGEPYNDGFMPAQSKNDASPFAAASNATADDWPTVRAVATREAIPQSLITPVQNVSDLPPAPAEFDKPPTTSPPATEKPTRSLVPIPRRDPPTWEETARDKLADEPNRLGNDQGSVRPLQPPQSPSLDDAQISQELLQHLARQALQMHNQNMAVDAPKPLMAYTRMFDGADADFAASLRDYLELRGDMRSGGWEGHLYRTDDFIRFASHRMIVEMLLLHGGEARRRFVFKTRKHQ